MAPRLMGPRRQSGAFYKKRPAVRKPRTTAAKLSVPMKKAVQKLISSNEETKFQSAGSLNINFNSAISSTAEIYNCIPSVNQSTGGTSYERVGQAIKPTKLECNWWISHNDVARSGNMVVSLFVLRHKTYKSFASVVAGANMGELLTKGSQGLAGFTGYIQETSLPVNHEQFTVVKRYTLNINKNVGLLQDDVTTGNSPNTPASHRHVKAVFKLPKLLYDDGAGVTDPNNQGLFWCLGYAHPDGTGPNVVNQDIQVSTAMNLYFKDA